MRIGHNVAKPTRTEVRPVGIYTDQTYQNNHHYSNGCSNEPEQSDDDEEGTSSRLSSAWAVKEL